jgi:hypothetical protein
MSVGSTHAKPADTHPLGMGNRPRRQFDWDSDIPFVERNSRIGLREVDVWWNKTVLYG